MAAGERNVAHDTGLRMSRVMSCHDGDLRGDMLCRYWADTSQLNWLLKSLNLSYQDYFTIASLEWQNGVSNIIRKKMKILQC